MAKSILLSKIRTEIRRQGMNYRTEQTYIGWITRFIYFHNLKHPNEMGEKEVVAFLNYLVTQRDLPDSIQSQAQTSLQFLYKYVLGTPLPKLEGLVKGESPYKGWSDSGYQEPQISVS